MLDKFNIFSFTLLSIGLFEGYQIHNINNLENKAEIFFKTEETNDKISNIALEDLKKYIINKKPIEKENIQISFINNIVSSPSSNIYDYSQASLVLSELLYSEKFLNIQQIFDNKNLFDMDDSQLSDNDKKYKELLILNNILDEKFKDALVKYQNNDIAVILNKFNSMYSYSKKWYMDDFIAINKKYNQKIDEYKIKYLISSPDYFDQVVLHFKTNKSLNKKDYYSIISASMNDKKESE